MARGGSRKGSGRKPIGLERRRPVGINLEPRLISRLSDMAKDIGVSRSEMIARLIEAAGKEQPTAVS